MDEDFEVEIKMPSVKEQRKNIDELNKSLDSLNDTLKSNWGTGNINDALTRISVDAAINLGISIAEAVSAIGDIIDINLSLDQLPLYEWEPEEITITNVENPLREFDWARSFKVGYKTEGN